MYNTDILTVLEMKIASIYQDKIIIFQMIRILKNSLLSLSK